MKINGVELKELAIEHGEKAVLGVVGVLVALVLATSTWVSYRKAPEEIVTKAQNASAAIDQSKWPREESEKFSARNRLDGKIKSMLQPIPGGTWRARNGGGLAFSIPPVWDLYVKQKPLELPELYPVQNVIATPLRMVIAKKSESELEEYGSPKTDAKTPVYKYKTGSGSSGRGGDDDDSNAGRPGFGRSANAAPKTSPGGKQPAGKKTLAQKGAATDDDGDDSDAGRPGMEQLTGVEGEGRHVVAVRGIVPIHQQLLAYEKALHLPEGLEALRIVQIFDFTLDRQVSSDGGKSWSKWQPVDTEANAKFLFFEVDGFETDVVKAGVTHPVITSPLPMRLLLNWGDEATHPDIEGFKQTPQGREKQRLLEAYIAEQAEKLKKMQKNMAGGFARVRRDLRGEYQNILDDEEGEPLFSRGLYEQLDPNREDPDAVRQLLKDVTAVGDFLLFRYFDFDVLPGLSYRYRVRLKVRNPLFEEPVEKVALNAQALVNKPFLDTPPSNPVLEDVLDENGKPLLGKDGKPLKRPKLDRDGRPTNEVTIPPDVNFFLTRVDQRPTLRLADPEVSLQIFQWFPKPGTTVQGKLTRLRPGQFIAGTDPKTSIVDPAQQLLVTDSPQDFTTRDLLLDAKEAYHALPSSHLKELGLFKPGVRLNIVDEILVVDERGELKRLDPVSSKAELQRLTATQTDMLTALKIWKKDSEEGYPSEDATTDDGARNALKTFNSSGKKTGKKKQSRTPRRRPSSAVRRKEYLSESDLEYLRQSGRAEDAYNASRRRKQR